MTPGVLIAAIQDTNVTELFVKYAVHDRTGLLRRQQTGRVLRPGRATKK